MLFYETSFPEVEKAHKVTRTGFPVVALKFPSQVNERPRNHLEVHFGLESYRVLYYSI